MPADAESLKDRIDALTHEDWKPLLSLIPEIESTSKLGERDGGTALVSAFRSGPILRILKSIEKAVTAGSGIYHGSSAGPGRRAGDAGSRNSLIQRLEKVTANSGFDPGSCFRQPLTM